MKSTNINNNNNTNNYNTIVEIGTMQLPGGISGIRVCHNILQFLDIYSLLQFIETSYIKQFCQEYDDITLETRYLSLLIYPYKHMYELNQQYRNFYPPKTWGSYTKVPIPFIIACEFGLLEDVRFFIENHHINTTEYNPSDVSIHDMIDQLGYCSDTRQQRSIKWTGLTKAAGKGHVHIVKYLIDQGANVNKGNAYSFTSLMYATQAGNLEIVKLLLQNVDINVSLIDKDGENALHWLNCEASISPEQFEIMTLLMNHRSCTKATLNKNNRIGEKPLDKVKDALEDEFHGFDIIDQLANKNHFKKEDSTKSRYELMICMVRKGAEGVISDHIREYYL